jgi:hypothetical protein
MGRPLNKRWFGMVGTGSGAGKFAGNHLPIKANVGTGEFDGYIIKQRATHKFKASRIDNSERGIVKLVDKTSGLSSGEGALLGIVIGTGPVALKKLTSHVAVDFSGNRYSWTLQDDSTATLLILTAI